MSDEFNNNSIFISVVQNATDPIQNVPFVLIINNPLMTMLKAHL